MILCSFKTYDYNCTTATTNNLCCLSFLTPDAEFTENQETEESRIKDRVNFLELSQRKCKSLLEEMKKIHRNSSEPNAILVRMEQVEMKLNQISMELELINAHLKNGIHTGGFQWVDSLLVKVS